MAGLELEMSLDPPPPPNCVHQFTQKCSVQDQRKQKEPSASKVTFVQPGFWVTLGFKSDTSSFQRRMLKFLNPSASCQRDRGTVGMVSKNQEPGVALQRHRS